MKTAYPPTLLSGSKTLYVLTALVVGATAWAYFTPVDIAVRARGIVRPQGDPVRIVSEVGGRIHRIPVQEGWEVSRGDPLVQFDTRDLELKKRSLEARIHFMEIRLEDLRRQLVDVAAIEERSASIDELDRDTAQKNARTAVENARSRFNRTGLLMGEGLIARQSYDDARAALAQAEAEETRLSGKLLDLKRAQAEAHLRDLTASSIPLRSELAGLYQELEQCRFDIDRRTITSPIDGQITSLASLHAGEIIGTGTAVAAVVPRSHLLVIESWLPTSDRAFVDEGQPVRLQTDSFPADQYNAIDGAVLSISPDARFNEALNGAFRVLIAPAPGPPRLQLGMTFQVHFITRQERLIWVLFQKIHRNFD